MLQELLVFGIKKGFFEIKNLGQLNSSCCSQSILEVIDYDETAKKIKRELNNKIRTPKSADALKIIPKHNRVDFIELKGFEKFIKYQDVTNDSIESQIKDFNLREKIESSSFILDYIIRCEEFTVNGKSALDEYRNKSKNFIITTDIESPLENRLFLYDYLAGDGSEKMDTIKQTIMEKLIQSTNNISLNGLNRPVILSCNEIDGYYASLEQS